MKVTIVIENVGGIFYVNHKRLGHDKLSDMEITALNEFIKEFKENLKSNIKEARRKYFNKEIDFNELEKEFFKNADVDDLEIFYRSPVFDRPLVIEGKNKSQRDKEFLKAIE